MDRGPRLFPNPWLLLAFEALFVTASETLLKVGASRTERVAGWEWTGLLSLASIWIWCAIALVIRPICRPSRESSSVPEGPAHFEVVLSI